MKRIGNTESTQDRRLAPLVACFVALLALGGCKRSQQQPSGRSETQYSPPAGVQPTPPKSKPIPFIPKPVRFSRAGIVKFDINWPPRPPAPKKPSRRSLLIGQLGVCSDISPRDGPEIFITLTLTRPHASGADREFWNAETAFKQYKHWMPYVRGRDAEGRQWLWPNLACLFKARGTDRVERYGGWDPGKKVDNDFGAVLIRKLDLPDTPEPARPLVSADWHSVDADDALGSDLVHSARSDTFILHPAKPHVGAARLWFIYGDFMTWRPPWKYASGPMKGKPLIEEHSGGIIAQFRINWRRCPKRPFKFTITQETPNDDTGFNWKKWINRKAKWDTPKADPRITDRPKPTR